MQADFEKTQPGATPRPAQALVPEPYVGLWQRLILQLDAAPSDVTSTVFWLQTRAWHAQMNIPAPRPDFSGTHGLPDCSRDQLMWLARQGGFVGLTEIEGELCTRGRHSDFRPAVRARDVGRMVFIDRDTIVETGLEARYLEIWERVPGSSGLAVALERLNQRGEASDPLERILVTGEYMMHVRSRCSTLSLAPAASLLELIEREKCSDERARDLVDFEISFARQTPGGWRTQLSTLPFVEGRPIIARESLPSPSPDGFVVIPGAPSSRWRVLEWAES
jgi:hypothetical protein